MPVNWTAENDRKLLLNLITTLSTKDINAEALASLFPGATPKAILERVAKLRRELKATNGAAGTATTSTVTATAANKPTTTTPVTVKAATTAKASTSTAATSRKRGRQIEEGDAVEDVVVKKRGRGRIGEEQGVGEGVVVKNEGCGRDEWDGEMG